MTAEGILLSAYAESHPSDLARACDAFEPPAAGAALAEIPAPGAARVLQEMSPLAASRVLASLPAATAADVAAALQVGILTGLLRRLDAATADRILASVPAAIAAGARRQLSSPDDTAGSLMDPMAPAVDVETLVADFPGVVREPAPAGSAVFVLDAAQAVVGLVDAAALLHAAPDAAIRSLMRIAPPPIPMSLPLATVAALPEWQTADVLPVVDEQRRFAGSLEHRRLRQVAAPAPGTDRTMRTLLALGEVYWLGLSGLMQGLATTAADQARTREQGGGR